ncbi:MAG: NYN domain-containing protein [Clostridiaceae bacterium]|nr:NYN domain-containing protein [Clostridiaceae bacterium]
MAQETSNIQETKLAVLIDADNISHHNIKGMMEEIARYGNATIKRIYGDWTRPNLSGWKNLLLDYAISPIQQFGYTSGKNSTDSAMIIDAMDILYADKVDGFCLVSSDSDFTRLAMRLREAGRVVYGIGEQKTPNAFIAACDRFIYIEILEDSEPDDTEQYDESTHSNGQKQSRTPQAPAKKKSLSKIGPSVIKLISDTIRDAEDENGWAYLGEVGNLLLKKTPSFDPRNYGYSKLTPLIKAIGRYEIDARDTGNNSKQIYIRIKSKR